MLIPDSKGNSGSEELVVVKETEWQGHNSGASGVSVIISYDIRQLKCYIIKCSRNTEYETWRKMLK